MTLVSVILKDAYRETNLVPEAASLTTAQTTAALNRLNVIIASTMGFEAGDELVDINYGGEFDQSILINEWIPDNARLVLNLEAAVTLDLDPDPYEGQRVAIVDVGGTLDTYNLTLNGNGRKIEGAASLVLNTEGAASHWMYRADTGNWVKIEVLESADEMPFPIEFDDYFVISLALRLNPRHGQILPTESHAALARAKTRIRNRYRRRTWDVQTDPGLLGPEEDYRLLDNARAFNSGRMWPWLT